MKKGNTHSIFYFTLEEILILIFVVPIYKIVVWYKKRKYGDNYREYM